VNPGARSTGSNRGAENVILAMLALTVLGAVGFVVLYIVYPSTQLLGLAIGLAFGFMGVAAVVAANRLVPQETAVEERTDFGDEEVEEEVAGLVREGGEGVSRRRLLIGAAGGAAASVGGALIVPAASLGPNVGDTVYRTPWQRGRRVVHENGRPMTADEVKIGTFLTGFPEGASTAELGSSLVLVRVAPEELAMAPDRAGGAPDGVLAFSKICPHAGCAVSMYRHPLYEPTTDRPALVCPCHYSTFDVRQGGALVFGPSGRDLPRLPLAITAENELVAEGDFLDPVGPSYGGIRLGPGQGRGRED
jgi:ubiquinol-cytochrome c reductase iron-sulfur subunit